MEVTEVGAPAGRKVRRSFLRKRKQVFIRWLIIYLRCMCRDNLIFHGIKRGESLVTACVEHVVCTCSG